MKKPLRKKTKDYLESIVKRLVENLNIEKIILFGSHTQGTNTKDSDVDLLIMLKTNKKGIKRYAMVSELLEPRKVPLDIIVKTPAEIKKRENHFDPFMKNIFHSGTVLYEKKT